MSSRRTTIGHRSRTNSFSQRASTGSLTVARKHCPSCGHHKVFNKQSGTFCTKCRGVV